MAENNSFDVLDEINKKYFTELEHWVPHIQQTLFDLQNEFYKSWRNTVTANTSLFKEFVNTSEFQMPKATNDLLKSMSEEGLKYREVCNKLAISNIESVKNSTKTWNDNADTFVELNRKIMHFWLSAFSPKRN
ncbi:MAG: hypothetical protein ACRBBZ_07030 [Nitrosopumilus sp.]